MGSLQYIHLQQSTMQPALCEMRERLKKNNVEVEKYPNIITTDLKYKSPTLLAHAPKTFLNSETVPGSIKTRIKSAYLPRLPHQVQALPEAACQRHVAINAAILFVKKGKKGHRSEERRVGKECPV